MPLYSFKCNKCGCEFEAISLMANLEDAVCIRCKGPARVLITGSSYHSFPEGWFEHIGPQPLHISSRSQLKEECEKNDCYATYLDPPISFNKKTSVSRSQH